MITEAEYEAALQEIQSLMNTTDPCPRLDALVEAVEEYEDVHYPIGQFNVDFEMRAVFEAGEPPRLTTEQPVCEHCRPESPPHPIRPKRSPKPKGLG